MSLVLMLKAAARSVPHGGRMRLRVRTSVPKICRDWLHRLADFSINIPTAPALATPARYRQSAGPECQVGVRGWIAGHVGDCMLG